MPMMAAIAARTQRLKFGPSVMMLPLWCHPITVAKEMATLDFLALGRVIMAVGLGADEHEAAAFNVPLKQRGPMTDEGIAILRKLGPSPTSVIMANITSSSMSPLPLDRQKSVAAAMPPRGGWRVWRTVGLPRLSPPRICRGASENRDICGGVWPGKMRDRSWYGFLPCRRRWAESPARFCGLLRWQRTPPST